MIVVADAGPLIHLAAIGQLHLIHRLSPEVLVPQAVFDEIVIVGEGLPGALEVKIAARLTVVTVARGDVVDALLASGLHRGGSEAIAVAPSPTATELQPWAGGRPSPAITAWSCEGSASCSLSC